MGFSKLYGSPEQALHVHKPFNFSTTQDNKMSFKYTDLGLVNTKEMFAQAMQGKYAVPAYNFNNMEQLQAIVTGCAQSGSPVIL